MLKSKLFLLIFVFSIVAANAEIKVASILGDNMVLQRNTEVKIWGKASPNQQLVIQASWNKSKSNALSNEKGDWLVKIKTSEAGGPYTITISAKSEKVILKNILLGEVWLCSGQSNMAMPVSGMVNQPIKGSNDLLIDADNDNIRLFTVSRKAMLEPQDTCGGKWNVAAPETVSAFSAVGYMYAKQLQQKLQVPVGIINSSWGGSRVEPWMNNESIIQFPEPYKRATEAKVFSMQYASATYNGMIAPIVNFAIKGVLWYQGEANIGNYTEYAPLLAAMVKGWRKDFGVGEFPFYAVQIAPYKYNGSKELNAALQRDEQLKAISLIPNSSIVSTIDIGEENCIHPAEKFTVAKRLFCLALSETYGTKGINYKLPTFKSLEIKDSTAIITFNNIASGITSFGSEVQCFEIAGADQIFYPAKITINNKAQVIVNGNEVKNPVAVRYAFCNYPKTAGYLYNTAALPVPSFRTDNWEVKPK